MFGIFRKAFQQAHDQHKRLWGAATQSPPPTGEGGRAPSRDPATAGVFLGQTSWGNAKQKTKAKNKKTTSAIVLEQQLLLSPQNDISSVLPFTKAS